MSKKILNLLTAAENAEMARREAEMSVEIYADRIKKAQAELEEAQAAYDKVSGAISEKNEAFETALSNFLEESGTDRDSALNMVKLRVDALIPLLGSFDKSISASSTSVAAVSHDGTPVKKRRGRRSKAEIEADRLAEQEAAQRKAAEAHSDTATVNTEPQAVSETQPQENQQTSNTLAETSDANAVAVPSSETEVVPEAVAEPAAVASPSSVAHEVREPVEAPVTVADNQVPPPVEMDVTPQTQVSSPQQEEPVMMTNAANTVESVPSPATDQTAVAQTPAAETSSESEGSSEDTLSDEVVPSWFAPDTTAEETAEVVEDDDAANQPWPDDVAVGTPAAAPAQVETAEVNSASDVAEQDDVVFGEEEISQPVAAVSEVQAPDPVAATANNNSDDDDGDDVIPSWLNS